MSARRVNAALAALLACTAAPALAQTVAITGGKVVIGDGSDPIEGGTVLVQDGKVVAAGRNVAVPAGVRTIDASGKWVTPGLVVAVTDIGLYDVGAVDDSNDSDARKSPFSAGLDLSYAINPDAQHIKVSRSGGVTRAAIAPLGTNAIFGGQGAVIDLGADPDPVMIPRAFQYVELGETGAARAGGSRVAAWAELHDGLIEARELSLSPGGVRRDDVRLTRRDAQALIPVVTGNQPLYVHVERAADIRMVLGLKKEFPLIRLVIVGATEGWMVAGELARSGVPVLATPLNDLPASFEQLGATQSNVGRMKAGGVKVALGAFFDQPRYAPQYAGNMVALSRVPGASGMTWNQAFAAISSGPAEAMGLGDRIGSLRPGRAGDVVIWDGDPLELQTGVSRVFIDGVEQPLSDHQTRLRDRYAKSPSEGSLPKAYDW
ncbi:MULTISPECIES: amidohydrolase family protein [unclassified Novosphingobium]|uniref:amidohydrolase family protein n=1 Tax=unclassified Novosphingobium TaxID=2644732 RepID=UPI000EC1C514|nr:MULTISPECIES: amidohydrolase family protein [unclassified Novosphingobium]HCF25065.1 amidohydrolase [Novosphingobium sp.]HQV02319.1 amidohydrolase family protein [Novosphingobium sp.]